MSRVTTRKNLIKSIFKLRGKEPEAINEEPLIKQNKDVFQDRRFNVCKNRRQQSLPKLIPETGDRRKVDRRRQDKSNFEMKGDWYLKVSMDVEELKDA